jgi:hypothetical protein
MGAGTRITTAATAIAARTTPAAIAAMMTCFLLLLIGSDVRDTSAAMVIPRCSRG